MQYVFPPGAQPTAWIHQAQVTFPVRRVYCIGRNYAAHAREMGGSPEREVPFFFCKPADAVVPIASGASGQFRYPMATTNCHHEVELVVAIGQGGRDISQETALRHVFGYAIGLDMTRRDLQNQAKAAGRPWDTAKAFDGSAPLSPIFPVSEIGHVQTGVIWLDVNGQARQRGNLSDMIWSVSESISVLSTLFTLQPGDLLFTGTPEGVGPVKAGDQLLAGIAGLGELQVTVSA